MFCCVGKHCFFFKQKDTREMTGDFLQMELRRTLAKSMLWILCCLALGAEPV